MRWAALCVCVGCLVGCAESQKMAMPTTMPAAAVTPVPVQGDFVMKDFHFRSGQTLPELRIHYRTLGRPRMDDKGVVQNAVLIMHGTTGTGAQFFVPEFGGQLFGPGQPLDASAYYLIFPDDIGHGQSSRPSEGLHARFPNYGYRDMVEAEYRLVTEGLKVNHLRLVMGTSMGGMHTWLWGETYPEFEDTLMPLASLPDQIAGRNRMWRKMIIDEIRTDPEWKGGDYMAQPRGLEQALAMLFFMSGNPRWRVEQAPTGAAADKLLGDYVAAKVKTMDANDVLYAVESSRDYDPAPGLEKITVPLLAINSADDLINPSDMDILERGTARVKSGRAVVLPETMETRGHGTHTMAWIWKDYLVLFLHQSQR